MFNIYLLANETTGHENVVALNVDATEKARIYSEFDEMGCREDLRFEEVTCSKCNESLGAFGGQRIVGASGVTFKCIRC